LLALACATSFAQAREASRPAQVLDSIVLDPARFGDAFGGISGVDYDARRRRWMLLSDDRSEHAPARFYAVTIARSDRGRWHVGKARRTMLADARASPFSAAGFGREVVDPEAIRFAPDGHLIWASEGDAQGRHDPAIRSMDRTGREREQVPLPANLRFDRLALRGPRSNATIEGLDFTPDGAMWVAMEGPLIEDGLPAADGRTALVRFTRLRRGGTGEQFAYSLDSAPPPPSQAKAADNGVTEILALDDRRMLVLERSGAALGEGRYLFRCRLYLADFANATEVAGIASLKSGAITPASKRLLLDFATLSNNPGNLEAMAWWPSGQGRPERIVLLNDNNFAMGEPTRLLLLALPPDLRRPPAR
jgi:hypothetical protein